jgi:hypothetical protein
VSRRQSAVRLRSAADGVLRLRIKDADPERREIRVRDGKGKKDRVTMLPGRLIPHRASTSRVVVRGGSWAYGLTIVTVSTSRIASFGGSFTHTCFVGNSVTIEPRSDNQVL